MAVVVKKNQAAPAPTKALSKTVEDVQETMANVEASVTINHPDGSEEVTTEVVGQVQVSGAPAKVCVGVGLTKNLGNYESLRAYVELTLPCAPTEQDIEESYAMAKSWVDDKINEINSEVSAQIG